VRYADDFIVIGKSKTLLETKVKPAIEAFLADRGLELSKEKAVITYIRDGFTFLGQTFRKHGSTLHVMPSKEGVWNPTGRARGFCAGGQKQTPP
jgi:RNA-directed DNA polymerase